MADQSGKTTMTMLESLSHFFARDAQKRFFSRADVLQFLFCSAVVLCGCLFLWISPLKPAENVLLDFFFQKRPPLQSQTPIRIIEIKEETLRSIGRWPWPWNYHAKLLDYLTAWQVKAVVFHFPFQETAASFENQDLEKALQKNQRVYFPVFLEDQMAKKYWVHSLPIVLEPETGEKSWTSVPAKLEQHTKGVGYIYPPKDADGVLRHVPISLKSQGKTYPYLGLRVARDLLRPAAETYPWNQNDFLINWLGPWRQSFKHDDYADVIRSGQALAQGLPPVINPEEFKGSICLIGLTAKEGTQFQTNPLGEAVPPAVTHAHVLHSLLTRTFIRPAPLWLNAAVLAVLGLLMSFILVRFGNIFSFLFGLGLCMLWAGISFFLFCKAGIWFFVLHPLILIITLYLFSTMYAYILSNREKAKLFDLATRDGLTGLFVIRYFREILNRTVQEVRESKTPLSVLLMDIDNFKSINDTYGHGAGDSVLKKTAKILQNNIRQRRPLHHTDMAARYGGEEFILMLRGSKLEDAAGKTGERVRREIEKTSFEWEGKKLTVTISIGAATLHPDEEIPDRMVRRADEALYQAKRTGKNRVCLEPSKAG